MFYLQDCKEAAMAVEWLLLGRYEQMYIYPRCHRDQRNKSWWESLNKVQMTQNSCKTNVIAVASHDWGLLYIPGNPWMTDRQLDSCELLISGDCSLVFKSRESISWILKISELKFQLASWESACGKMGSIASCPPVSSMSHVNFGYFLELMIHPHSKRMLELRGNDYVTQPWLKT